jgi:hypothetical protein
MTKDSFKSSIAKHRIDIIVIASILLLSLIALLIASLAKTEGNAVRVEIDGKVVAEYPLGVDGEYVLGDGTNVLTVKNGEAYMTYSECPDHTCEDTKPVKYVGNTIICLPNKITVTVTGEKTSDSPDLESR